MFRQLVLIENHDKNQGCCPKWVRNGFVAMTNGFESESVCSTNPFRTITIDPKSTKRLSVQAIWNRPLWILPKESSLPRKPMLAAQKIVLLFDGTTMHKTTEFHTILWHKLSTTFLWLAACIFEPTLKPTFFQQKLQISILTFFSDIKKRAGRFHMAFSVREQLNPNNTKRTTEHQQQQENNYTTISSDLSPSELTQKKQMKTFICFGVTLICGNTKWICQTKNSKWINGKRIICWIFSCILIISFNILGINSMTIHIWQFCHCGEKDLEENSKLLWLFKWNAQKNRIQISSWYTWHKRHNAKNVLIDCVSLK